MPGKTSSWIFNMTSLFFLWFIFCWFYSLTLWEASVFPCIQLRGILFAPISPGLLITFSFSWSLLATSLGQYHRLAQTDKCLFLGLSIFLWYLGRGLLRFLKLSQFYAKFGIHTPLFHTRNRRRFLSFFLSSEVSQTTKSDSGSRMGKSNHKPTE